MGGAACSLIALLQSIFSIILDRHGAHISYLACWTSTYSNEKSTPMKPRRKHKTSIFLGRDAPLGTHIILWISILLGPLVVRGTLAAPHPNTLADPLSDCLTVWLSDCLTVWLSDCLTVWLTDYLTDWLSGHTTVRLSAAPGSRPSTVSLHYCTVSVETTGPCYDYTATSRRPTMSLPQPALHCTVKPHFTGRHKTSPLCHFFR